MKLRYSLRTLLISFTVLIVVIAFVAANPRLWIGGVLVMLCLLVLQERGEIDEFILPWLAVIEKLKAREVIRSSAGTVNGKLRKMTPSRFQFSTRDLLVATTIISIILAIGVWLGGLVVVVLAVGLVQVVILLAGDWLIRPENRRALAFATTLSWITLGCGLAIIAIKTIVEASDVNASFDWLAIEGALLLGAAGAFLMARHRWRKLGDQGRENL